MAFFSRSPLHLLLLNLCGTDEDAGILSKIAGHVEVDADMLWNAVEIWAREYNVKSIKEEEE